MNSVPATVHSFFELQMDTSIRASDDRRSAIEFRTNKRLLLGSNCEAIVLPESFLDDKTIVEMLRAMNENMTIIGYPVVRATSPDDYTAVIRDRVMTFLEGRV